MPDTELTPVEVTEQPWEDPWTGLLSGTYRARVAGASPDDYDHHVVYIRGAGGNPAAEYRSPEAICGVSVVLEPKLTRLSDRCPRCVAGLTQAFAAARARLARDHPDLASGELG